MESMKLKITFGRNRIHKKHSKMIWRILKIRFERIKQNSNLRLIKSHPALNHHDNLNLIKF